MPVGPCLPAPQPAEHRAAGRSQSSVLLTKFEKGIIYVSCIFLGLTAKNGKQYWGTLIVRWLEEQQPWQGTGRQTPTSSSPIESLLRVGGGKQEEGAGGLSCSEITEGFSAKSFFP